MKSKVAYTSRQAATKSATEQFGKFGPLRVYQQGDLFFLTSHRLGESARKAASRKARAAAYMQRWMPA